MISNIRDNAYKPSQGISPVQICKEICKLILKESVLMETLNKLVKSMSDIMQKTRHNAIEINNKAINSQEGMKTFQSALMATTVLTMVGTSCSLSEKISTYKIKGTSIREKLANMGLKSGLYGTIISSGASAFFKVKEAVLDSEAQKLNAVNKGAEHFMKIYRTNNDVANDTLKRDAETVKEMIQNNFRSNVVR